MLKNHLFFIGFRSKVVRGQPRTTGTVSPQQEEQQHGKCPHNSPSYTIESPLARPHSFASPRPLARTNETKRFPGWRFHKRTHPPNLQYRTFNYMASLICGILNIWWPFFFGNLSRSGGRVWTPPSLLRRTDFSGEGSSMKDTHTHTHKKKSERK